MCVRVCFEGTPSTWCFGTCLKIGGSGCVAGVPSGNQWQWIIPPHWGCSDFLFKTSIYQAFSSQTWASDGCDFSTLIGSFQPQFPRGFSDLTLYVAMSCRSKIAPWIRSQFMANLSCLSYPRNNKKEKTDLVMQKSSKIKNTYPCIYCKKTIHIKNHQNGKGWSWITNYPGVPRPPRWNSRHLGIAPKTQGRVRRLGLGWRSRLETSKIWHVYTNIYTYTHTYVRTLHYITLQYSTLRYVTLHYITYIHYIYIYIARPITFEKQYQGKPWPSVRMPKETDSPIPCNTGPYMASSHSLGEGLISMPQLMDIAEQPFFRLQSLPQNQVVWPIMTSMPYQPSWINPHVWWSKPLEWWWNPYCITIISFSLYPIIKKLHPRLPPGNLT